MRAACWISSRLYLLFCRVGDVVGHGVVEQVDMLGDQGVLLAQLAQLVFADVDAIQQDLPCSMS